MNNKYKKAFSVQRVYVYHVHADMASKLQQYLLKNKNRLAPYEPLREPSYYEYEQIRNRLIDAENALINNNGLSLLIVSQDHHEVVGTINFTNFVFGYFQACHLGFSIDSDFEGQGIMKQCLIESIGLVKQQYDLHRIMANHLPTNLRSAMLLRRIGFIEEGFAKSYIKINGQWQDHVLTSYVFES